MNPATALLWIKVATELMIGTAALIDIGQRIIQGDEVSDEELNALRGETKVAVNRFDAAAVHDSDAPPETGEPASAPAEDTTAEVASED